MIKSYYYLIPIIFLFFKTINCIAQNDTIYKNKNVIDFKTPLADLERSRLKDTIEKYEFKDIIENRDLTLNFFNLMTTIAEPSTVTLPNLWIIPGDRIKYFNKDYEKKPFIFSADIKTPIALGGKRWFSSNLGWMNTLHIIPQFKVRMFRDDWEKHRDTSFAVRTPSYMPGIAYYGSSTNWWKKDTSINYSRGLFLGVHAFHHSNGQDSAEFLPNGTINRYNGNFGENLVIEFIFGGINQFYNKTQTTENFLKSIGRLFSKAPKRRTMFSEKEKPLANRMFYWRTSYELHPPLPYLTNEVFDKYNIYGQHRLNVQLGYSIMPSFRDVIFSPSKDKYVAVTPYESKELFRWVLNFSYILDPKYNIGDLNGFESVGIFNITRRVNTNLSLYWRMSGAPNAALFTQVGYYGSDLYNIYFQQNILQFRLGLAMAFFKYPKTGDFEKSY